MKKHVQNLSVNVQWPDSGVEALVSCPVCGGKRRQVVHKRLVDNVFYCAPGKWTLCRCTACRSAYLSERPTKETIALAYANYYTHDTMNTKQAYHTLGAMHKLRRRLINGYKNWRYALNEELGSFWGVPLLLIAYNYRQRIDFEYRHLPACPKTGGQLLDIGCGNGTFLYRLKNTRWKLTGIDVDQDAVESGRKEGLNLIQADIENINLPNNTFDVITLNHVIEHVYDPVALLEKCFDLLKPGGTLWLQTPNIDSLGHIRYKEHWRGLEVPRHLVLFTHESLKMSLFRAGFENTRFKPYSRVLLGMTEASECIKRGLLPGEAVKLNSWQRMQVLGGQLIQMINPSMSEFITVKAWKKS